MEIKYKFCQKESDKWNGHPHLPVYMSSVTYHFSLCTVQLHATTVLLQYNTKYRYTGTQQEIRKNIQLTHHVKGIWMVGIAIVQNRCGKYA